MMDDYTEMDVVAGYARVYDKALDLLDSLIVDDVITSTDVDKAVMVALQFDFTMKDVKEMNQKNLHIWIGLIKQEITKRYDKLVVGDVLERFREESSGRLPKGSSPKVSKSKSPEEGWNV